MYEVKKNKKGQWIVIAEGKKRASKVFDSKIEAIAYATKKSKDEGTTFRVEDSSVKSKNKLWIILVIILLIALVVVVYLFATGKLKLPLPEDEEKEPTVIVEGELSIHFLELGNYYAGDSVYIKAGDTDILIDAGSRASSSTTIHNYIKDYCKDGKLEYVIATHAHEDHISGFVGTKDNPGIFDLYECDVIIDYAFKNTTSQISKSYEEKRDSEVTLGAKHFTAKDCMEGANGASSKYNLTESINFEILDQKYYYEKSSDENNYSVCMMLNYGEYHFLFTGDLEKEGEESLVEKNNLPHCKVFKGGHHGSKTSSNEALLSKITPEVVCVCCCAGSSEYTDNVDNMFPTQDFINRIAKYTNRVYVTTLAKYEIASKDGKEYPKVNGFESMNGNIVVTLDSDGNVVTTCSNNDRILKETEWFSSTIVLDGEERKMRTWPSDGK
ncbi:MAG: MBL fold metallo-hydrolase [Anaeroplasmataceae bacterium]|nr:MBL fold metallo-hydrolase [Anaeroplasmataceae bacterium]